MINRPRRRRSSKTHLYKQAVRQLSEGTIRVDVHLSGGSEPSLLERSESARATRTSAETLLFEDHPKDRRYSLHKRHQVSGANK